jgi:hypothetical protein
MQHTRLVAVRGALHTKDPHSGANGHPQARRTPGNSDGVPAAQGFGIVQDFHLKLVVEGLLCFGIESCREKDPQSCHGSDENRAQGV